MVIVASFSTGVNRRSNFEWFRRVVMSANLLDLEHVGYSDPQHLSGFDDLVQNFDDGGD